jgi:hypothetical protein
MDAIERRPTRILAAATAVLAEAERGRLDRTGHLCLLEAHHRLLVETGATVSADLRDELARLVAPFLDHELSESEALLAQAQLVGWLTGLVQGLHRGVVAAADDMED